MNGHLGRLVPRLAGRIMPLNNFILATAPLGEAGARALIRDDVAVADTKLVIDYFRRARPSPAVRRRRELPAGLSRRPRGPACAAAC